MKQTGKRLVSMLLAVCMIISLLPLQVLAATTVTVSGGAQLFFDESTGTITGCSLGSATHVDIPEQINSVPVTTIGWGAFENCAGLVSVTIPDTVTTIVDNAFMNCTSLKSVTIPGSVK